METNREKINLWGTGRELGYACATAKDGWVPKDGEWVSTSARDFYNNPAKYTIPGQWISWYARARDAKDREIELKLVDFEEDTTIIEDSSFPTTRSSAMTEMVKESNQSETEEHLED